MFVPNTDSISHLVNTGHTYEDAERIDRLEQEECRIQDTPECYRSEWQRARLADVQAQLRTLEANVTA